MKRILTSLLFAASLTLAHAQSSFYILMDGDQVVPPVSTPGWGIGNLELDELTGAFDYSISYFDLQGVALAMNLYVGAPGNNGASIFDFEGNGFTQGETTGSVVGVGVLTESVDILAMLAENTYVQIFTLPGAPEIRGQVLRIPEPTGAALAGLGALGLLVWRRRASGSGLAQ
jgi:hypothetical protein